MKMFKCTQAAFLLVMLVAHGTNPCSADFNDSQADLNNSYVEKSLDPVVNLPIERGEQPERSLPDLVGNLGTEPGEQLERSLGSQNAKRKIVAFFVGMYKNFGPVDQITTIVFDNIITNIGSGYSVSTGVFQAPVAGTYQFNVNVAAQNSNSAAVAMFNNGLLVMIIWSEATPNWAPASNVAIFSMKAGDRVYLTVGHRPNASKIYGLMYTTFSGFLISED